MKYFQFIFLTVLLFSCDDSDGSGEKGNGNIQKRNP
jgi:hypothetical protein